MRQWEQVSPEFARVSMEADEAPAGPDRVRAHEGALRLARANGSFAEEFVARVDLTQAMDDLPGDPRKMTHFAWLRQALAPEHELEQGDRDAVLWRLKWAVDLLEDMPDVPLDSLRAAIDDVEQVFRADGYHLRPVHAARARLARNTDDPEGAARELAAWLAEPRDSRSDCEACERKDQARLLAPSDPDRALDLIAPTVAGELTCGEEPRTSLGLDAVLRVDRGEVDAAVTSFRRAWHLAEDDPKAADTVADCLRVLLRLGNTDRAVDLLLPRLRWLEDLRTPYPRMWFAGTAALVLDRAAAVGLAPDEVDGRPTAEVAAGLRAEADRIAAAFDARHGSTVVSDDLAAALDPAKVPSEPTLPPTRLPDTPADVEVGRRGRRVEVPEGLVERAESVRQRMLDLDPEVDDHVRAWLRDRDGAPEATTPQEWSARAFLDRVSAQDTGGPERYRARLGEAADAARRAGDDVELARAEAEVAILDGDEDAALAIAERFDAEGRPAEAAGVWRRLAWFGRPADPAGLMARSADAYRRAGHDARALMGEVEIAMALGATDPERATRQLDEVEPRVAGRPLLASMVHDVRGRLARGRGDLEEAERHLRAALAVPGTPERVRVPVSLALCDVLVDANRYDVLEGPAADLVAAATTTRDPVLLAHGQRFLGLAYVETGRPAEAAELLEAALPVLREHAPPLVGPVGWALGNSLTGLGHWAAARTAFATAATSFEAEGRILETAHAQWRAGNAAWDAEDLEAAASHFEAAVDRSREVAEVPLHVEALRSRAALRADTEDLAGGLADLDAAIAAGDALAREAGVDEDGWDGEVVEPHVLRQGAHLLAKHGDVDGAVERLRRAEALVGADLELALGAEAGVILADADRPQAEARLRELLPALAAHGLDQQRVEAAAALARFLEREGRAEEAEQVWERFGPDA
ncbi:hypothetical protein ACK8HX_16305 [Oryzobacter sp. R7]|uniref:hypothetical protein n=1 Tax=Oryzobacter faecalis TaxID=3388656 RepID=UPI00398D0F4E